MFQKLSLKYLNKENNYRLFAISLSFIMSIVLWLGRSQEDSIDYARVVIKEIL